MGAAFAIQVKTGMEGNVKKLMEWAFERNTNAQKWIKGVHTFSNGTRKLKKDGNLGKLIEKAAMPGYLFIEMNYSQDEYNNTAYLPADLWHLIKSVPGVLRQFTKAGELIGVEQFDELLQKLTVEEQVEAAVPVVENEVQVKEALHTYNMAISSEEKIEAEIMIDELINQPSVVEQVEAIQDRVIAFMKRQTEVVRVPMSLFVETLAGRETPNKKRIRPSEFIPLLFKNLKVEVLLN